MRVKVWGTQGSLPSTCNYEHVQEKLREALHRVQPEDLSSSESQEAFIAALPFHVRGTYGGNTSCVEVRNAANDLLILDAGTGIRPLGMELLTGEFGRGEGVAHLLFSHFHWDHIQGFPFFVPAYIKGNRITLWGNTGSDLRAVFAGQQSPPYFPVGLEVMQANPEFRKMPDCLSLYDGRFQIHSLRLDHPGGCYAYRIEADDVSFVYATDAEYKRGDVHSLKPYVEFFREADVLVFDAQFSVIESIFEKRDWGHSAAPMGVEIACAARVRKLVLFHHDPGSTDPGVSKALDDAREYACHVPGHTGLEILAAYDGMELGVG